MADSNEPIPSTIVDVHDEDEMTVWRAVHILSHSARGRQALLGLHELLQEGGLGLDQGNKAALLALMRQAFGKKPGTTVQVIRWALKIEC